MILFIVGAPAVGKTTLVRALLGQIHQIVEKPKWTVAKYGCAAGHYTGGTFDGADTVPYNGKTVCLDYWLQFLTKEPLTILDGDRFSDANVVTWFRSNTKQPIVCAHLYAPETILEERRTKRGSTQNASWMKGRETKAKRFAEMLDGGHNHRVLDIDASVGTIEMLKHVRDFQQNVTGTRVPA
jgi:hypothetical protein